MLKPIAAFAVAGAIGVVVAKFLWVLLLPVFGMFLGFVGVVLKVLLIALLIWLGLKLFQKITERPSES